MAKSINWKILELKSLEIQAGICFVGYLLAERMYLYVSLG